MDSAENPLIQREWFKIAATFLLVFLIHNLPAKPDIVFQKDVKDAR
jgi:hypothetical protein